MSYRNITVLGKAYRWTTGRTHTKIVNPEGKGTIYLNAEYGVPIISQGGGWDIPEMGRSQYRSKKIVIGPKQVKAMILGEKMTFQPYQCRRHSDETITGLAFNPFAREIYGKGELMSNCYKCVDEVAQDI